MFLDAGPDAAPTCGVKPDLGGLQLGSTASPAGGTAPGADWFEVFGADAGGLAGKTYFDLAANLPPNISGDNVADFFAARYVKPATGFALNTAVPFNSDPNAATPAAFAYMFTDVDASGGFNKFYYASSGGLTMTAVVETDGGITTGMMSATNFREVDEMTGTDVTGGCTTKLTGVSFTVKQTEIADTPFQDNSPQVGPSLQGRMAAAIAKHQATLVQVGE